MKAALIVWQYMSTYWHYFPAQGFAGVTGAYTARQQVKAPKIRPNLIKQLQTEVAAVCNMEKALLSVLTHYTVPNANQDKIMIARTNLLAAFGKTGLRVAVNLDAEETKMAAMGQEFPAPEREKAVSAITRQAYTDAETKYRAALIEALVFTPATLPSALYPGKKEAEKEVKEEPREAAVVEQGVDTDVHANKWDEIGKTSLKNTTEAVLKRVGLKAAEGAGEGRELGAVGLNSLSF